MQNSIRQRRKQLKISQEELAKLTEVTRQTILAVENDKYDPSLRLAFLLADELNTTVDDLFDFNREMGKKDDF
ncbi:helix-turn-helix transcriptional regulator [Enterococcus sp. ALS3]|uniref:Helix-turn-helix transcriptional regulator n=1 Tax=Enterococcus alishanensis TaxID=1303817 RepID=A0ABS6TCZ3_9ENTE|nr:helix-turn-helix transcriptional regulator [Enterococcus alishanensis]MBV7390799.1 helix-turn-helix transcriptional regulator [Enterococcus alishanensis]